MVFTLRCACGYMQSERERLYPHLRDVYMLDGRQSFCPYVIRGRERHENNKQLLEKMLATPHRLVGLAFHV